MRTLKFRAWDKVNNRMMNDVSTGTVNIFDHDTVSKQEDCEFMQFTGLRDKNGKEIYESDYLGDWCVYWGSGKYILQNISTGDIIDCDENNTRRKEITGNRFENPREHEAMASDL